MAGRSGRTDAIRLRMVDASRGVRSAGFLIDPQGGSAAPILVVGCGGPWKTRKHGHARHPRGFTSQGSKTSRRVVAKKKTESNRTVDPVGRWRTV